ncbi:sigma-54-dependent Fis family transcriptional regulator [Bartonella sp. B10834G6]|uniref:Two-component system, NtrC family, nitrogen regulation response regulator NtrX n=1 Tax=Bartonella apis TaxID=1686310 RepID=A0A1R0F805_9HYPH|nr:MULTISPECIES: sigma-54 dependent transcriptional regulator [Bartonella]MBH9982332.1 sigma-54-dependent Fis family transcriptional regulator [Bartonella apis]MBH9987716.1 sigma-54-dependent Fis family transcriptional regulator [Bartonella apis]MBI0169344.1 sigma-54-dependent Fis family transcriptional regulator [Bartonella sp. W8167]MBI0172207.1 sigma-54-dependent Fis family transcriptional regulator [Bartonella sp. W8151]MBI0174668.1 sigma-54-dependent Fis family transcriptional regulator [
MASDILIVDDEADIRELVGGILEDEGHETRLAANSDEALQQIENRVPRLIFLDIWLQGSRLDGLALLDKIKTRYPDLPVVMISGHGNIETAVSAIKRGAYDFIEKPFKADRLILVAERALETSKLKREVSELRKQSTVTPELLGKSLVMNHLRQTIEKVAPTNSRIMITGPSGSGKETTARAIHALSNRANGPFVTINAATITPERMEIELFGTEMDGGERKVGALEEAHGGILYIDEIADMPRETQNKILRVLTDQTFERVGGSKRVKVDVRVISSTAQNLEGLIAEGRFREDLFHRLAVVPIAVPPLASHREDIPELVHYFIHQISEQAGIKPREIGDDTMAILQAHNWPGNIRQLRNNIERLLILARGEGGDGPITAELLPAEVGDTLPRAPTDSDLHIMALPLREARELFEKEYLVAQINRFGGNISRTAEFVGMERSALHRKLKSLGVS